MRTSSVTMAVILCCSLLEGLPSARAQGPRQPQSEQEKQNIAVVRGFWREVWEGHDGNAVPKYLFEGYIEHNNGATNGRTRMESVFGRPLPPGMRANKIVSQTIYARGPFVLLVQNRVSPDPARPGKMGQINMIEMVEVFDGLMQEHWMLYPEAQAPANQPQTEQEKKNIAVVKGFWNDVWVRHDGNAVSKYVAESFIEHNDAATNGEAAVERIFGSPRPSGATPMKIVSQTIYARGPFVVLLQDRAAPDPARPGKTRTINLIEMFQVYDGLLQQHWMLFPSGGMWPSEEVALRK